MAIQIRRGNDAEWESNKSNIVAGEPAVTLDSERMFVGTGSGTYMELANLDVLADAFDSSASYEVGDFVAYHGKVYKFTSTHSGAWNASDVEEVALADALDSLGEDVYTKAEADALLALKADASDVNSALALKADKSDTYTKTEVNTALDLKADKSNTYTKTQVDTALNLKSDKDDTYTKTEVNTALALKADKTTTYTKTEVDSALTLKADKSDTYTKTEVNEALEDYAKVDGFYEGMTAGNAEQLVTNLTDTESEPFTFRTSGGSLEVGDREELKVVGGSVAWNQLVQNGSFSLGTQGWAVYNASNGSGSVTDGEYTYTILTVKDNQYANAVKCPAFPKYEYHVYIQSYDIYVPRSCRVIKTYMDGHTTANATEGWNHVVGIVKSSSSASDARPFFGIAFASTDGYSVNDTYKMKNCCIFDLTAMFGTTIADYVYSLEQSTAGAGVAFFKKYFPKDYYAYNAGETLHVKTSEFKTVGFNQWDEKWEVGSYSTSTGGKSSSNDYIRNKNLIRILPNTQYFSQFSNGTMNLVLFYDAEQNYLGYDYVIGIGNPSVFTTPSNAYYMNFRMSSTYGTTYKNDICINLHWDGTRDGEYEPYTEHSYPLDSSWVGRGVFKLDNDGNLYADGDIYPSDGHGTDRFAEVDLGTLNWENVSGYQNIFVTYIEGMKPASNNTISNSVGTPYIHVDGRSIANTDKSIAVGMNGANQVMVHDSTYTDATAFKTAMAGQKLVYELANPTDIELTPFTNPQIVDNWGTEEFVVPTQSGVEIPVGHETVYPISLRDKLESAPNLPDGDGDYLLHMASGEATYKQLVSEFPSAPTTDGTYVLKATVSNGTATLTWVAE